MNMFIYMLNIWREKVDGVDQHCFCDIACIISANSFQYFICLTDNGARLPSIKSMGESRWVVSFWKLFSEERNNILQARHILKKKKVCLHFRFVWMYACVCVCVWGGVSAPRALILRFAQKFLKGYRVMQLNRSSALLLDWCPTYGRIPTNQWQATDDINRFYSTLYMRLSVSFYFEPK